MEPETLGKYEVRDEIGRGAVGTVYVAWDPVIERRVAVKKLHGLGAAGADDEVHVRFRQEARAAGRLSHPHIVSTFDYGETADCAYIVMELLPGPSLREAIKQRSISREDVGRIMDGILSGLRHSHERGVVHRDIKPGNIVFAEDGEVKITDFGIARLENSDLTRSGSQLGTPAYMAPEQVLGEPTDARADLYAAGVVLFEMLTFRRPFEGGTSSVLHRIVSSPPPPPSQFAESVSPELDDVLAKALAKAPGDRFQSAAEFASALRAATGRRDPASLDAKAADRRHAAPAAAASRMKRLLLPAAAVLLLAGGAAVVSHRLAGGGGRPVPREEASDASPAGRAEAPTAGAQAALAPPTEEATPGGPEPGATAPQAPAAPPAGNAAGSSQQSAGASPPAADIPAGAAQPEPDAAPSEQADSGLKPPVPAEPPAPEPSGRAASAAPAIEGGIGGYSADGWPLIAGRAVRLAGVSGIPVDTERLITGWAVAHGGQLSCEPAQSEAYRCLTAQSLDLSQTILLNGLAKATPDAAQAYREAEQQARQARRGLWK